MDNLVNKTKSIVPGRKLLKAILKNKLRTDSMTRVPINISQVYHSSRSVSVMCCLLNLVNS